MSADTPTGNSEPDSDERRDFVETLLVDNAPLLAGLFRKRMKRHADDALQEFVTSVLMDRLHTRLREIDNADERTSLLVHAAQDFCVDFHRNERGRRNTERNRMPPEGAPLSMSKLSNNWAGNIFTDALERTKAYFLAGDTPHYWHAFSARVSTPIATGNQPPPPESLTAELGFKDNKELHQAVNYVKRRVRHMLNEVLLEHAAADDTDFNEYYSFFMNSI